MSRKLKFAPRKQFETLLDWAVMPTFDLVVECRSQGVIIVKRKIAPYKNQWALPGLRQYKGEGFKDTLKRIAKDELGLEINPSMARILGQYDGFFRTEHQRQDISTGYHVSVSENQEIRPNLLHFSSFRIIKSQEQIPSNIGAMYKFYLQEYSKSC